MLKLADLLANGAVMGRRMQPFEAHLPYSLQFLMDHNLYGMDWVDFRRVAFRLPCLGIYLRSVFDLGEFGD